MTNTKMNNPLRDYNNRRKYWQLKNQRLTEHERIVKRALIKYLKEQRERVLNAMPKKGLADEVFNTEREAALAKTLLFPTLKRVMEEEGKEVAGRFDIPFTFTSEMEAWLDNRTEVFTRTINETTYNQIKTELTAGVEAGDNYQQMADRISGKYDQISTGRAKTIAITETHAAQQKSNYEGYKQSGTPIKIWVATLINTRDSHRSLDGQEVPFDRPFSNGLMFPGDPSGPAKEVINCACQI